MMKTISAAAMVFTATTAHGDNVTMPALNLVERIPCHEAIRILDLQGDASASQVATITALIIGAATVGTTTPEERVERTAKIRALTRVQCEISPDKPIIQVLQNMQ